MVNFGSEARGYSLMLLAALAIPVARRRSGRRAASERGTPWWLALIAALGMLSHMTMAAPVALVALWVYLERRAALGPAAAMRRQRSADGPSTRSPPPAVVAFVFAAAAASPTGMQLGGYLPFSWREFAAALNDMTGWTAGLEPAARLDRAAGIGARPRCGSALRPPKWLGGRARLYAILILGVPLGAALVQSGNSGFARYYLASAIGLLLLGAEWIARGLAASRRRSAPPPRRFSRC